MKKIIKNNLLGFIIGGIVFSSMGVVLAYAVLAKDVSYTPKDSSWKKSNGEDITNVKDAIDELYNKASIFSKFIIKIRTESFSKDDNGVTNFNLDAPGTTIKDNYKYFKITDVETNENLKKYELWGYDVLNSVAINLDLNKEYELSKISNIWVPVWSKTNGQMAYAISSVEFYN